MARAIVSGNAAIAIASEANPLPALTLGEILATSDLPGGVVNILTGPRAELAPHVASHLNINAIIDCSGDDAVTNTLQEGAAANLKRVSICPVADWFGEEGEDPYRMLDTLETKTAWHPIGI
jgi:acyl-CoA reductase-like NAD-dependent aldehyde dehydrogenase